MSCAPRQPPTNQWKPQCAISVMMLKRTCQRRLPVVRDPSAARIPGAIDENAKRQTEVKYDVGVGASRLSAFTLGRRTKNAISSMDFSSLAKLEGWGSVVYAVFVRLQSYKGKKNTCL